MKKLVPIAVFITLLVGCDGTFDISQQNTISQITTKYNNMVGYDLNYPVGYAGSYYEEDGTTVIAYTLENGEYAEKAQNCHNDKVKYECVEYDLNYLEFLCNNYECSNSDVEILCTRIDVKQNKIQVFVDSSVNLNDLSKIDNNLPIYFSHPMVMENF